MGCEDRPTRVGFVTADSGHRLTLFVLRRRRGGVPLSRRRLSGLTIIFDYRRVLRGAAEPPRRRGSDHKGGGRDKMTLVLSTAVKTRVHVNAVCVRYKQTDLC